MIISYGPHCHTLGKKKKKKMVEEERDKRAFSLGHRDFRLHLMIQKCITHHASDEFGLEKLVFYISRRLSQ